MPRRARFAIATLLFTTGGLPLACGGGSSGRHPDAAGTGAAGGTTGTGGFHVPVGTGNSVGTGNTAGTTTGAGGSLTGTAGSGTAGSATGTGGAAGSPMATGSLVFQGNEAALINNGPPCTGEEGATGDRWCAFFTPLASYPGDLYVVNVSKAAAGTEITCGTTDANCLHLTSSFTQDPLHVALFQGDTLVYFDGTFTPFAWRPGMTAGRALAVANPSTMDVVICIPSLKGTAVFCLRDLPAAMQTNPALTLSDIIAGHVDDAATPPLVRIETVISSNTADANVTHFNVAFPVPGTDLIAWSSRATASGPSATGPETLKTQTLGNDASRVTVATGVNSWRASPDGTRWYWLSAVNETSGVGTLQSAPYPAGTGPTTMTANTVQFDFPTPTSLVVLDTGKNLRAFANPASAPTAATSLDTGVIGLIALSLQGHVAYAKTTSTPTTGGPTFANMFVKKFDGTGACTITATANGYPPAFFFTPDSTGVTWIQNGSAIAARYTRLSDCAAMTGDSGVVWTQPLGNRGVLFIDGYDSVSGTGALRMQNIVAGNTLATDPLSMISGQVGAFTTVTSGGADIVVYTVNGGGNDDGVYVRGFGN